MKRLTSNKNTSDMSMIELAHNSCYIDNKRNARYRDYNLDIDSRQLARNLMKDICNVDLTDLSDEEFEEYMGSMLQYEIDSTVGLLALFYRNLWAIADLREKLKEYEDLEEQGRIIKFYHCESLNEYYIGKRCGNFYYAEAEVQPNGDICLYYKWSRYLPWGEHVVDELSLWKEYTYPSEPKGISFEEWLKGWLCEAKAKLKELRGEQNGKV